MKDYGEICKFTAVAPVKKVNNLQVDSGMQVIIQYMVKVYKETADK